MNSSPQTKEDRRATSTHWRGLKFLSLAIIPVLGMGADGCWQPGLGPGEVGTATCLACHDGRSASDHREFRDSPHNTISCESCHGPGLTHVREGGRFGLFIKN
ncbi:MAG: hypothetical protein ABL994_20415, partial [Verrucomicrobiales bacterium]